MFRTKSKKGKRRKEKKGGKKRQRETKCTKSHRDPDAVCGLQSARSRKRLPHTHIRMSPLGPSRAPTTHLPLEPHARIKWTVMATRQTPCSTTTGMRANQGSPPTTTFARPQKQNGCVATQTSVLRAPPHGYIPIEATSRLLAPERISSDASAFWSSRLSERRAHYSPLQR